MSSQPAAAPAAPKPKKPRKPKGPAPTVTCERCGVEIGKSRYSSHLQTLACAVRTYNNRCAKMMRERGYVPIESYYNAKIWRLLPEDYREMGPSPRSSASMATEVSIWVKEELGAAINGALKAHLDEKLLFRIAHVAVQDPEIRAAMCVLFLSSPKEAFYQGHGYRDPTTGEYKPAVNPEREALLGALTQWVGDWESVNLPDEPTD